MLPVEPKAPVVRGSRRRPVTAARSLLVGKDAFTALRAAQANGSGPRLDMRYLIEGAVALLSASQELRSAWIDAARGAFTTHLQVPMDLGSESGTGVRARPAAEGASARTHGGSAPSRRHADCRSLQVGESAFERLKAIQRTTHTPRLEMRYLVEGAVGLLRRRADQQAKWERHARQALIEHLSELQQLSLHHIHLEQTDP